MSSPVVVTTELLLFKRQKYMNDERTAYLRKYHFVAVEQLALDIRLPVRTTFAYMRRLGLRHCSNNR
jgi:hypothetical protein